MNEAALAAIEGEALQGMMQPQPLPQGTDSSSGTNPGISSVGSGFGRTTIAAIALLALGGVAVGLLPMPGFGPSHSTAPAPVAIEQPLTQPDTGPGLILAGPRRRVEQAIDAMLISDGEKAHLRTESASGKARIGWLSVSDSEAEDGDWVTVSAVGLSQDVRLYHKPTTLAVAYVWHSRGGDRQDRRRWQGNHGCGPCQREHFPAGAYADRNQRAGTGPMMGNVWAG